MNRRELHARSAMVLGAGFVGGSLLLGCQSPATITQRAGAAEQAVSQIDSALRRLEAMTEIEAVTPRLDESISITDLAPNLPTRMSVDDPAYGKATMSLDEIVEAMETPTGAVFERPVGEDLLEAQRLYANAREARLRGDSPEAVAMLNRALELDAGSAELWQELGTAHLAGGESGLAGDALMRAVELGSRDGGTLLTLASESASRGNAEGVIRYAALAWGLDLDDTRKATAGAMLGTGLLESGHERAGARVLGEALDLIQSLPPSPQDPGQLVALRARSGEFRVRAGDALAALGDDNGAMTNYRAAAEAGAGAPVIERVLGSGVRSGQAAGAALDLVEHLDQNAGAISREEARWYRALVGSERVGGALAEACAGLMSGEERLPSARHALLRVLIAGPSDAEGVRVLVERFRADAGSPVIASDVLLGLQAEDRVWFAQDISASQPEHARSWAAALLRLLDEGLVTTETLLDSGDADSVRLGVAMAAEIGRSDLVLDRGIEATPDTLMTLVELNGNGGRWDALPGLLERARVLVGDEAVWRQAYGRALLAAQRLEEAAAFAADLEGAGGSEALLIAGEIASALGDAVGARRRFEAAAELDPTDERAMERLIGLADVPVADDQADARQQELVRLGRAISERMPRSALFAMMRARDLGTAGRPADAATLLMALGNREPGRDLGTQMLVQAADAAADRGRPEVRDRVLAWLAGRLERAPGSVPVRLSLAGAFLDAEPQGSFEMIDDGWARLGNPEFARSAELMLGGALSQPEQALTRGRDRLSGVLGVDGSIELAELEVRAARLAQAIDAAGSALPVGGALTPAQTRRWTGLVFVIARGVDEGANATALARLIERAQAGYDLPEELDRVRVLMVAQGGDPEQLLGLIESGDLGRDATGDVIRALLAADRVDEALGALAALTTRDGTLDEDALLDWLQVIGGYGSSDEARVMIDHLDNAGMLVDAAAIALEQFAGGRAPGVGEVERDRADLAYVTALIANILDRTPESEAMYGLALELDPTHGWAGNDLGYALADRGERLDEAERMLQVSYDQLSDQASVTDSLGWVRYKMGVLEDEVDADGAVVRLGAVSLLTRASTLEDGIANPTIWEHLGDARWRAGDKDGALDAWIECESVIRDQLRGLAGGGQGTNLDRQRQRLQERLAKIRRRISDGENGREPEVAPWSVADREAVDGEAVDGEGGNANE